MQPFPWYHRESISLHVYGKANIAFYYWESQAYWQSVWVVKRVALNSNTCKNFWIVNTKSQICTYAFVWVILGIYFSVSNYRWQALSQDAVQLATSCCVIRCRQHVVIASRDLCNNTKDLLYEDNCETTLLHTANWNLDSGMAAWVDGL